MIVVQNPERIDVRQRGLVVLLPIEPPQVHTLFFKVFEDNVKVCSKESPIGHVEGYRLPIIRLFALKETSCKTHPFLRAVQAQIFAHLLVFGFKVSQSFIRVIVESTS